MISRRLKIGSKVEDVYFYTKPTNKEEAWDFIKRERQVRYEYGGYNLGNLWYHSDSESLFSYLGLALVANDTTTVKDWKTMSGQKTDMTYLTLKNVMLFAVMTKQAIFNAGEAHWDNVSKFTTSQQFENYDYFSNWPPAFFDLP